MTSEEEVTYARINNDRNATIIIVIDPTGISEQIYFLTKMLELYSDRRFLVVFGMADETEKSGSQIYINKFEQITGVPCISVSARKGTGISELIYKIYEDKFSRPFRKIKPEKLLECFNIAGQKTKIELYFDKFFLGKFFGTAFFFTLMFFVVYVSFGNIGNKLIKFCIRFLLISKMILHSIVYFLFWNVYFRLSRAFFCFPLSFRRLMTAVIYLVSPAFSAKSSGFSVSTERLPCRLYSVSAVQSPPFFPSEHFVAQKSAFVVFSRCLSFPARQEFLLCCGFLPVFQTENPELSG